MYEQSLYPVAEYAFKHPLTQEVAYQSLLSERRTRTHAAVARALEADRGTQGEAAAVIAYHWESAGERVPAARWHDRAATWAANRSPVEAVRHWQRVRALLVDATDAPDLAELVLAACTSLLSTGLALGLEDTEAAIIFAEGIRLAARVPTANAESQLVAALAFTNLNLGRLLPALAASERSVQLLSTADIEPSEASRALNLRAVLLALAGQLPSAAELLRRAEQLIPAANELGLAVLSFSAANLALQSGEFQLAVSRAERALDLAGRTSSPYVTAMANWMRGDAQNRLGHFAAALHSFEEALATGAAITVEGYFLAGMALAHLGLGDHDRAGLTARHAIEVARKRGHAICECYAQLTLARVLTDIEGASAAAAIEAALQEGERLIAESGARLHEPAVHDARARLAGVCGDPAGRERELRTALRLYTEMGATGHVERISHQLSAISDQATDAERT